MNFLASEANVGQRPYSIRTRIKTAGRVYNHTRDRQVRDHIPLEQGLRLELRACSSPAVSLSETIFH